MKKILLGSAAIFGLAMASAPVMAQDGGVNLELGGYFKGYGAYVDQDERTGVEVNDFDFLRDTEIHFTGESTLDNGLTVGAHIELDVDGGDGSNVDESYLYMSGMWGRVNFGDEDGAAYLLQVAAPSADSNIDGLRQFIQPVNYSALLSAANFTAVGTALGGGLDYDQDISGKSTKLTYFTPVFSGFQLGATFAPDAGAADDLEGIGLDNQANTIGQTYEIAARYEGQFDQVGIILGAGYSFAELEATNFTAAGAVPAGAARAAAGELSDDRQAWNVGLDLDFGPFGLGAIYMEDDFGERVAVASTATAAAVINDNNEETLVVGADYTTGPFKLGVSYMNVENTFGVNGLDTDRYSGGVVYTYGPGMTFRGSIGYVEHELNNVAGAGTNDVDATYVTLGTQINF